MAVSKKQNLRARLAAMPKVELHRHLEGSLRLATLLEVGRAHGVDVPLADAEALRPLVQVTYTGGDLSQFLSKFPILRKFYQSPEVIARFTREAVADAAAENIRYMELRFNPVALASTRGYTLTEVCDWVSTAAQAAAREHKMQVELIITVNRMEPQRRQEMLQVALDFSGRGVVAMDLAGDEVNFPPDPYVPLFQEARAAGLQITAHAGEGTSAESVRSAIELLGAQRIGHGARVVDDVNVMALARERGVAFEVCLTSNIQTSVAASIKDHPVRQMIKHGLAVSLNTDDPGVQNTSLTDDFVNAHQDLGMDIPALERVVLRGAEHAFISVARRAQLVADLQSEFDLLSGSL